VPRKNLEFYIIRLASVHVIYNKNNIEKSSIK